MKLETLTNVNISATLLSLLLLLLFSFIGGKLMEKIKAPKVVGEILGGMIIGGSCLGFLFPNLINNIYHSYPEQDKVLNMFYQLGLMFLMFSSGFNTNIKLSRNNLKISSFVFLGATILPMLLGLPFLKMFEQYYIGSTNNHIAFTLVFVISIAITSIPVISKIFFDIGIMNTNFSNIVLSVSTFQDLCLWILLNLSLSLVSTNKFDARYFIIVSIITILLLVIIKVIEHFINKFNLHVKRNIHFLVFFMLISVTYLLSLLNINIMYSSFIAGYLVKALIGEQKESKMETTKITDFAMNFFVPIYFALVGIQINVINGFSFSRFLIFFLIAFSLEFIGVILFLIPLKIKKATKLNFAITFNARGGPGIVLATIAYANNIINAEFFTVLILLTMLSSMIAGYWLRMQKEKNNNIFNEL